MNRACNECFEDKVNIRLKEKAAGLKNQNVCIFHRTDVAPGVSFTLLRCHSCSVKSSYSFQCSSALERRSLCANLGISADYFLDREPAVLLFLYN